MTSIRNRIPDILTGHMLAAAPTGGGKSHGIGKLVEELHETNRPFVILDTKMINHVGLAIGLNKTLSEKSPKRVKIFRVFPDSFSPGGKVFVPLKCGRAAGAKG